MINLNELEAKAKAATTFNSYYDHKDVLELIAALKSAREVISLYTQNVRAEVDAGNEARDWLKKFGGGE